MHKDTNTYTACGSDILMTSSESTTEDDNLVERLGVSLAGHRKKYRQTYNVHTCIIHVHKCINNEKNGKMSKSRPPMCWCQLHETGSC